MRPIKMSNNLFMNKVQVFILLFACIGFSCFFYSTRMSDENIAYAIEQINFYNTSTFADNICVQGNEYSPKLIANMLTSALMRLMDTCWADIAGMFIQINYVLYGLAAANAAWRISCRNKLLWGILVVYCCHTSSMGAQGFGLWGAWVIFLGTGIAIALLGISFVIGEKKNWNAAWICAALAAFMHVHEGMWGGCTLGVLWVALRAYQRKIVWQELKCLPIFIAAMLIVALPSVLFSSPVDNDIFVNIYAFFRTPHHLVPVVWTKKSIFICLVLITLPLLYFTLDKITKRRIAINEDAYICGASVLLYLFLFILEIFVTSISPNATVVSMYVTKCFKYVTFIALLYMLKYADIYMENHEYVSALLCLWMVIFGQPYYKLTIVLAVLLAILRIFALERSLWKNELHVSQIGNCMVWVAAFGLLLTLHQWTPVLLLCFGLLLATRFVYSSPALSTKAIQYMLCVGALVVFVLFMNGKIIQINDDGIRYISGETCLVNRVGTDIYRLSKDFQSSSSINESFLANPYDVNSGRVQLISERNCYVVHKNLPTSASAVIEWYDRIKQVEGITKMNGDEIAQMMRKTGCNYVLLRPEQYAAAEGSEQLELFVKSDTAAFYMLKKLACGE